MKEPVAVWEARSTLGEGPAWDRQRGALWFVDIKAPAVHRFSPHDGAMDSWPAPAPVGWVLPAPDGTLVAGLKSGLARFDPADGSFVPIAPVEPGLPGNRLNDATVGPDGTIWFGSMDDGESEPTGRFFRWDGSAVHRCELEPVAITNGPAISAAGNLLYHVDTVNGLIRLSEVGESGRLTSSRLFAHVDPRDGYPDGVTLDAQGNLWVGLWGGWRVRQYGPDGLIRDEVEFPVANVTKVAFGGARLTTCYATTARAGLGEDELAGQPLAGSLFAFEVPVPGNALPLARLA